MARVKRPLHGGNIYEAARALGCNPNEIIDFSASINPLGPSPRVWKAITSSKHLVTHYPDPDSWDLRRALATSWRIDPAHFVVGNGSTELIDALPRALGIDQLLVVQPTFSEYAAAMTRAGGKVCSLYADRNDGYAIPLDRLRRVIETGRSGRHRVDAVILCHPNSPTGQACTGEEMVRLAKTACRYGRWLIIDESFADYCPDRSILRWARVWPRVVVLRSMTKFYALPGLRVGYAVSAQITVRRIQRQLPPWSVSVMGQVAAVAALNDAGHAHKSLTFMAQERERFERRLAGLPGCTVMPTCANYILLELPHRRAVHTISQQLREQGLLIRDCSLVPGLNSRSIRLAVRTIDENERLVRTLSRLLTKGVSR